MLFSTLLTSLAACGGAYAAVMQGSWGVRADFSRCDSRYPLEAVLDGVVSKTLTTPNITDFRVAAPFEGSLAIKPAGAVGWGSPYQPQQVVVNIFDQATGNPAAWANATVKAGYGQLGSVSQIRWGTGKRVPVQPHQEDDVSASMPFNGGTLTVTYCGPWNGTITAHA